MTRRKIAASPVRPTRTRCMLLYSGFWPAAACTERLCVRSDNRREMPGKLPGATRLGCTYIGTE
jgi:hypothetical protein